MSTATALVPAADSQALVPHGETALYSPLPVFTGEVMAQALTAYRNLQKTLDASMPDQIMTLDGKPFRKKGYWRAIAVAFNLTVEPIDEKRESNNAFEDGRENFGFIVTYRATAPNGRSATGDGSCFAVEKATRFKCPHPEKEGSKRSLHWPHEACPSFDPSFQWRALPAQATEHNIRSHAHTRAFNRAVSNLVGFGEVSAEEVDRDRDNDVIDVSAERVEETTRGQAHQEATFEEEPRPTTTTQPTPPASQAAATQTSGPQYALRQHEQVIHVTSVVKLKEGDNDRGHWVMYGIETKELGPKKYISTFSATDAREASRGKKDGKPCAAIYNTETKGRFVNHELKDKGIRVLEQPTLTADRDPGAEG